MTAWRRIKRAARRADADMPVWGWLAMLFALGVDVARLWGYL